MANTKNNSAAETNKATTGEQMDLIDVGPENLKKIAPRVRAYKAAMEQRIESLKVEVDEKGKILALVLKAKLKPLANGHIKFTCEGIDIDIEPRDFVIHTSMHKEKKKRGRPKKDDAA
jgi:hypothetical protein